jgi:hypothetical protein
MHLLADYFVIIGQDTRMIVLARLSELSIGAADNIDEMVVPSMKCPAPDIRLPSR